MKQGITLIPAYGRFYLIQEAMLADWQAGKDFRVWRAGPYTSIRDEPRLKDWYGTITLQQSSPPLKVVIAAEGTLV